MPSAKHLLVAILGAAAFYALRTTIWPRLGWDVPVGFPFRPDWGIILINLSADIILVPLEESLYRGIPWAVFLLFARVFGGREAIPLLCGLILFLLFNWLWMKGHEGTLHSRRAIFLSGLFYGWLLFWSGSILMPIVAHLTLNVAALIDECLHSPIKLIP